jgi:hypothetical protein
MVTVRDANMCSCAVIYQQLGICRGRARRDNHICVLYACTFVSTKFGAMGCPRVVDMCVGLVVVSVGKCYTTAPFGERKKQKKKKH